MALVPELHRIECVIAGDSSEPHKRIASIGLRLMDGAVRILPVDVAASYNELGSHVYFAEVEGRRVHFRHAHGPGGELYLRPVDAGESLDVLLSLPTCC